LGERIHDSVTISMVFHFIACIPPSIKPKPATPPTIACVVETGNSFHVDSVTKRAAERRAARKPSSMASGLLMTLESIILFFIVSVTCFPTSMAPKKFNMDAMIKAWRKFIALAPTAVDIEFATSFEPILHAIYNPAKIARTINARSMI